MISLRPYQKDFFQEIRKSLYENNQIIACGATGSGKTKVFIAITTSALESGKTVLIISESVKIFNQIKKEKNCFEINAKSAKDAFIHPNRCYLAMAQTLARREKIIKQFSDMGKSLIVISDESHVGTATKVICQLKGCYLIGFTATPDFRFAKHLPLLYKNIVVGPQPDELIQMGFLTSYRHFQRKVANTNDLVIKNGEFTEASQEFVFESKAVHEGLLTDLESVKYKKCMIFTASIKHCNHLHEKLLKSGYKSVVYHSKLEKEQEAYNLKLFESGDINICISVSALTKGYDLSSIDLIVLHRATTSLPLYLQMIGRGSRIEAGKYVFTVLDYGLNCDRHLPWDYERPWKDMWNAPLKKKKEGVAPIKCCPACDFIMPVSAISCPNCGHIFTKPPPTKVETELIEVTDKYRNLIGRLLSELTPQELAIYAKAKNKSGFATVIARCHGISFLADFGRAMNYKRGWEHFQSKIANRKPLSEIDYVLR